MIELPATGYRSHTEAQCRKALANGATLYHLDTDSFGEDDVLIAYTGEYREDVLRDVLDYYELDELPTGWTLERW